MDTLLQDVKFAARTLRHAPGFSLIAVITLALGIGTTTAMFSVLYRMMLAPLPYAHAEQLMHVGWGNARGSVDALNGPMVQYLEQHGRSFSSTATMFFAPGCNLVSGTSVQYVSQTAVSTGFFETFAAKPVLGRLFVAADALARPAQVAIISHGLWRERMGSDPNVIGQTIKCNGFPYTMIGVLPANFRFPEEPADVWVPDRIENYLNDTGANYWMVGRLRDGVTMSQAQQELAGLSTRFHRDFPKAAWDEWIGKDGGWQLVPLRKWRVADVKTSLLLMFAAVALVLIIAAANVAGLMVTRSAGRSRELATRLAVGATRARLVRQLLTEAVLLGVVGGIAGVMLAAWGVWLVSSVLTSAQAQVEAGNQINLPMLAFAVGVSVLAGLLAGTVPALQATRGDLYVALKQGDRGSGGGQQNRFRKVLVASEVALAVLLLVGATLLARTFMQLRGVSPGMQPEGVLVTELSLGSSRYQTSAAEAQFQREVLARVRAIPGVIAAATVSSVPGRRDLNMGLRLGDCVAGGAVQYRAISANYFDLMAIPLKGGRMFTDSDAAPVAIINQALARTRCFGGKDALGSAVWIGKSMGDPQRQVVGIVGDTHDYGPAAPATPTVYVPQWQVSDGIIKYVNSIFYWSLVVRSAGTQGIGPAVERAIREVDPEQAVVTTVPLATILGNWLQDSRTMMQLMGVFAGLALLLTAVGLYGVLNFYVTQRTREIGIRMALGATPGSVLGSVLGEGMLLVAIGAAIGTASALGATRLMKTLLFGVKSTDPATFVTAMAVLFAAAAIASYIPARRATRVDPMIALREE